MNEDTAFAVVIVAIICALSGACYMEHQEKIERIHLGQCQGVDLQGNQVWKPCDQGKVTQ